MPQQAASGTRTFACGKQDRSRGMEAEPQSRSAGSITAGPQSRPPPCYGPCIPPKDPGIILGTSPEQAWPNSIFIGTKAHTCPFTACRRDIIPHDQQVARCAVTKARSPGKTTGRDEVHLERGDLWHEVALVSEDEDCLPLPGEPSATRLTISQLKLHDTRMRAKPTRDRFPLPTPFSMPPPDSCSISSSRSRTSATTLQMGLGH